MCCCGICTICGCALCFGVCCPSGFSDNSRAKTTEVASNGDAEATTINLDDDDSPKATNRYDIKNVPSKLRTWLDVLHWILWVFGPFIGTLFITVALYRFNAIRTRNNELFNSALALFIIALFNLMVYFQQFMNSICGYGHKKVTNNSG